MLQQDAARGLRHRHRRAVLGARVRRARGRASSACASSWRGKGVDEQGVDAQRPARCIVARRSALLPPDRSRDAARRREQGAQQARLDSREISFEELVAEMVASDLRARASATRSSTRDGFARLRATMNEHGRPRIFVAGHRGLVGSAHRARACGAAATRNLLTAHARRARPARPGGGATRSSQRERPELRVPGRRQGRRHPRQRHLSGRLHPREPADPDQRHRRARTGTASRKLLFLGSSCIYPRTAPQPMQEDYLLTGPLEPTNESYAIAKIAGIKLCEAYSRQYGFNAISRDADQPVRSRRQLRPAELARAAGADPQVPRGEGSAATPRSSVWGSGTPRREFLHVDDLADACVFLMERYDARGASSTSAPARTSRSASWPSWSRTSSAYRGDARLRRQQARRHAAQAARCRASSLRSAGKRSTPLATAFARPTTGISRTNGATPATQLTLQKTLTRAVVPPSHHATSLNVLK